MQLDMQMGMGICITQVMKPCARSIFPRVEKWLNTSEHQRALEWVAARKKMDRYRAMIDFVCMEIFTELRPSCWRYYDGRGPRLKELLPPENILMREEVLLRAVEHAYALFCEQRKTSWSDFRFEVFRAA